ncbi:MAG: OmpH family outer membrane protein [Gemmatimonadetes bacterium]|nr:MAG: OmpH family outer membrane protein [Gemmatimonadota bacterium]
MAAPLPAGTGLLTMAVRSPAARRGGTAGLEPGETPTMRIVSLAAVAALLTAGGPLAAQNAVKIGYIHSQAIIAQDPDWQAAQKQFEQEMVPWQNELSRIEEEISTMLAAYQQQQVTLTPAARRERQQQIVQRQRQYQQRMFEIEQEAQRRQQELVQPIMERVNAVIQQIRTEGNYTFIFDASAGGLIAADEAFDLTDEVVRRLAAARAGDGGGA